MLWQHRQLLHHIAILKKNYVMLVRLDYFSFLQNTQARVHAARHRPPVKIVISVFGGMPPSG